MATLEALQEELKQLKKQLDQATNIKRRVKLVKVNVDDKQEELQKELDDLLAKKKNVQEIAKEQDTRFKDELFKLQMRKGDLKDEMNENRKLYKESEKVYEKIQENLMIRNQLPRKNINFKGALISEENQSNDDPTNIAYNYKIVVGRPFVLGSGEALLTFEEETVAREITAKKRHTVELNEKTFPVEALEPSLDKSVKFEVDMNISSKKLKVLNLPEDLPEEMLKDKVELTFYKSEVGGAEIESVSYDRNDNTACVTYLQNGVAQRVLNKDYLQFVAGGQTVEVEVKPCVDIELNKLQMFSAISPRTVLLTGIKKVDDLDEDDAQDQIQIRFQKQSLGGGEVEAIVFSQDRKLTPIFEDDLN